MTLQDKLREQEKVRKKIYKAAESLGQFFAEEAHAKRKDAAMMTPLADPDGQLTRQLRSDAERLQVISSAMFNLDALKKGILRHNRASTPVDENMNPAGAMKDTQIGAACTDDKPAGKTKGLQLASSFDESCRKSYMPLQADCGRIDINPARQLFGIIAQQTTKLLERKENRIIFEGAQRIVHAPKNAPKTGWQHAETQQGGQKKTRGGNRPSSIPPPPSVN